MKNLQPESFFFTFIIHFVKIVFAIKLFSVFHLVRCVRIYLWKKKELANKFFSVQKFIFLKRYFFFTSSSPEFSNESQVSAGYYENKKFWTFVFCGITYLAVSSFTRFIIKYLVQMLLACHSNRKKNTNFHRFVCHEKSHLIRQRFLIKWFSFCFNTWNQNLDDKAKKKICIINYFKLTTAVRYKWKDFFCCKFEPSFTLTYADYPHTEKKKMKKNKFQVLPHFKYVCSSFFPKRLTQTSTVHLTTFTFLPLTRRSFVGCE